MKQSEVARIGYVPYTNTLDRPGDKRRFVDYARARNLPFEIANPSERYDLVVLSEAADISIWCDYPYGKIVYDLIDPYLAIPRSDVKQLLRGVLWYATGKYQRLKIDLWKAIKEMCIRADAIVCTTEEQRHDILPYCSNTHIILDSHTSVVHSEKENYRSGEPFNIVWEGLPNNIEQLYQIRDVLHDIYKHQPFILNIVTDTEQPRLLGRFGSIKSIDLAQKIAESVRIHPWSSSTLSRIAIQSDLAIIPIDLSDPFVKGKPENKLLLFWRFGLPVVTSATPAYLRAMHAAGTKDMACQTQEEWMTILERMINDESLRQQVGQKGKSFIKNYHNHEATLSRWDSLFESLGFNFLQAS